MTSSSKRVLSAVLLRFSWNSLLKATLLCHSFLVWAISLFSIVSFSENIYWNMHITVKRRQKALRRHWFLYHVSNKTLSMVFVLPSETTRSSLPSKHSSKAAVLAWSWKTLWLKCCFLKILWVLASWNVWGSFTRAQDLKLFCLYLFLPLVVWGG